MTKFQDIYDRFLGKITDDMYSDPGNMWTPEDTLADMENIFKDALPGFEFPRFALYDYNEEGYNVDLTSEEINIFALLMYNVWLQRQIASIENIRMKYSGAENLPTYKVIYKLNFRKNWNPEMGIRAEVKI